MSTKEIKDIGNGIKDGMVTLFLRLLNGSWSLLAICFVIVWGWLKLTPEQIVQLKELETMLNSKVGWWLGFIIFVSYVVSIIGKLRDDIKNIFTNPVREMTYILAAMREDVRNSEESLKTTMGNIERKFEKSIDRGDVERGEILSMLHSFKTFIDGK